MKKRCPWCENTFENYVRYHDYEWGVPVFEDKILFEFLILESAQAGLSWSTVLKKREGYRAAFSDFDAFEVARYDEPTIQRLRKNPEIIRNELKIRSAVNNAQHFLEIQEEAGSFSNFLWSYVDGVPVNNRWQTMEEVPATTALSDQLSSDLSKRGFKFTGSTIMYAYMQAVGMVNDHLTDCFRHSQITAEQKKL